MTLGTDRPEHIRYAGCMWRSRKPPVAAFISAQLREVFTLTGWKLVVAVCLGACIGFWALSKNGGTLEARSPDGAADQPIDPEPSPLPDAADKADVAALAYRLWQDRGCPHGSDQEDWFQAARILRA